ncbi:SLP adapter and CSK-interacting membrane protein [Dendrobates tinctorius]|uniref:SLP adapter and CSK-interacting membrane protein n=1 Tax=Dendrobates tinctorius TaxID=92724 RepID=UPI003CCA5EBD
MEWYRQYFWLLVFGGIILVIAIISFVMVCLCRTQLSRSITIRLQRTAKQEKKQTHVQNVSVIADNGFYQSTAQPTVKLPESPGLQHGSIAEKVIANQQMYSTVNKEWVTLQNQEIHTIRENVITNQQMYATVNKEPVTLQKQGMHSEYNIHKYDADFHKTNKNDRYSSASYDSVGHITVCNKDLEYIEVLSENEDYDDVEII